ncbi:hypothetical protein FGB62_36g18 [Gracilaria domingensis]|nr:hypothetical protein FGB62_36g18 [Gracilaria domingensis]
MRFAKCRKTPAHRNEAGRQSDCSLGFGRLLVQKDALCNAHFSGGIWSKAATVRGAAAILTAMMDVAVRQVAAAGCGAMAAAIVAVMEAVATCVGDVRKKKRERSCSRAKHPTARGERMLGGLNAKHFDKLSP